jgi:predicted nucleic acid-binding protein
MSDRSLVNQSLLLGSQELTDAIRLHADILTRDKDITLFHLKSNRRVIQVQGTLTGWNVWDISHGDEVHIINDVGDEMLLQVFQDLSKQK